MTLPSPKKPDDVRARILRQATVLFAHQGFHGVRMREIARRSQVGVASIYHYFGSKTELMFAIPEEGLERMRLGLQDHLEGIYGALNKITKLVWFTLHWFESDPDFARLLYVVVQSHQEWRKCKAYRQTQRWAQIVRDFLAEGRQKGEIGPEVDLRLASSLIFGLLERVTVNWLQGGRSWGLSAQAQPCSDLLISALEPPGEGKPFLCPLLEDSLMKSGVVKASAGLKVAEPSP